MGDYKRVWRWIRRVVLRRKDKVNKGGVHASVLPTYRPSNVPTPTFVRFDTDKASSYAPSSIATPKLHEVLPSPTTSLHEVAIAMPHVTDEALRPVSTISALEYYHASSPSQSDAFPFQQYESSTEPIHNEPCVVDVSLAPAFQLQASPSHGPQTLHDLDEEQHTPNTGITTRRSADEFPVSPTPSTVLSLSPPRHQNDDDTSYADIGLSRRTPEFRLDLLRSESQQQQQQPPSSFGILYHHWHRDLRRPSVPESVTETRD